MNILTSRKSPLFAQNPAIIEISRPLSYVGLTVKSPLFAQIYQSSVNEKCEPFSGGVTNITKAGSKYIIVLVIDLTDQRGP